MKEENKELIAWIGACAAICGSIYGAFYAKITHDKKQKEIRREKMRDMYIQHNEKIKNELKGMKEFPINTLIDRILISSWISSSVKNSTINSIKTGRNKLDTNSIKQIYYVANNNLISDEDKQKIIFNICDGHVKTEKELELESKERIASYEYLKHKETEETKRYEMRLKYYEKERIEKASLERTKVIANSAKDIFKVNIDNTISSNTNKNK